MEFQDENFPTEDAVTIVRNAISNCLSEHSYTARRVNDWANTIVDSCLREVFFFFLI